MSSLNKFNNNEDRQSDVIVLNKLISVQDISSSSLLTTINETLTNPPPYGNEPSNLLLDCDYSKLIGQDDQFTSLDFGDDSGVVAVDNQLDSLGYKITIADGSNSSIVRRSKNIMPITDNSNLLLTWNYSFDTDNSTNSLDVSFGIEGLDKSNSNIYELSGTLRIGTSLNITRTLNFILKNNVGASISNESFSWDNNNVDTFLGDNDGETLYMLISGRNRIEVGIIQDNVRIPSISTDLKALSNIDLFKIFPKMFFKVEDGIQGTGNATLYLNSWSAYSSKMKIEDMFSVGRTEDVALTGELTGIAGSSFNNRLVAVRGLHSCLNLYMSSLNTYFTNFGYRINVYADVIDDLVVTAGLWNVIGDLEYNTTFTGITGGKLIGSFVVSRDSLIKDPFKWNLIGHNSLNNSKPITIVLLHDAINQGGPNGLYWSLNMKTI